MLRGTLVPFLFQYENVVIPVGFVARNDDFLARIESFDYLVGLRVLATDPDRPLESPVAFRREHVDPVASRFLVERPARNHHRFGRLAQLDIDIVAFARADVFGPIAHEMEVGLELAVLHFGIDFLDEQGIFRAAGFLVACAESRLYLVNVVLVDLSLQLEIGQVVDLGYLRAGRDPLSELCVEPAYLAVDRRLDAQIFQIYALYV